MGDHRATVKIEFSIYGETYKMDSWINWSVGGEVHEVDDRVLDFFRDNYLLARAKHDAELYEAERESRERAKEAEDRATYERLKDKFGE